MTPEQRIMMEKMVKRKTVFKIYFR
jgi:hypothetical protein